MLSHNQNGFRRGRSTISQLLSLRCVTEEIKRLNKELSQQMARPHSLTLRAGVLQGDNLASFLFVIELDYVLRLSFDSIKRQGKDLQGHPRCSHICTAKYCTDLDFANDFPVILELFKSDGQEKSRKISISWRELKNRFLSFFVHR